MCGSDRQESPCHEHGLRGGPAGHAEHDRNRNHRGLSGLIPGIRGRTVDGAQVVNLLNGVFQGGFDQG